MKILFLAPSYLNLYKPILMEMKRQGNEVFWVEDILLPFDFSFQNMSKPVRLAYRLYNYLYNPIYNYWAKKVKTDSLFYEKYDLLFCINGISFHPYLLDLLRHNNPNVRSVLYLWDTQKFYNYFKNVKYFDKVFTFDFDDALKGGFDFIPFYWCKNEESQCEIKYAISIIGTNHDNRYHIVREVANQLKNNNLPFYFKIYSEVSKLSIWGKLRFLKAKMKRDNCLIQDFNLALGKIDDGIVTHSQIPIDDVLKIIEESKCILDTDRDSQTGTTPRVIWALAMKKKIISTNTNLRKFPFYNEDIISIIDRNNPIVDIDFINKEVLPSAFLPIEDLRLDKWVKRLTGQS